MRQQFVKSFQLKNLTNAEMGYIQTESTICCGHNHHLNVTIRNKIFDIRNWKIKRTLKIFVPKVNKYNFDNLEGFDTIISDKISQCGIHHFSFLKRFKKRRGKVLCIGGGHGVEAYIAQALYPKKTIFVSDLNPELKKNFSNSGIKFYTSSHKDLIKVFGLNQFDEIYGSHSLEHIYDNPQTVLANVYGLLKRGGTFINVMPLEGERTNPHIDKLEYYITHGSAFDMDIIDPGHPWKTTYAELNYLLKKIGFKEVEFYEIPLEKQSALRLESPEKTSLTKVIKKTFAFLKDNLHLLDLFLLFYYKFIAFRVKLDKSKLETQALFIAKK